MHVFLLSMLLGMSVAFAAIPEMPLDRLKEQSSEIALYAYDNEKDAWILFRTFKGNPSNVIMNRDPRVFGPKRPKQKGVGYYRLSFTVDLYDSVGRLVEGFSMSINNVVPSPKFVFDMKGNPKWVVKKLKVGEGESRFRIDLSRILETEKSN